MTELVTGKPAKGDWKKNVPTCSKRGNHLYRVNTLAKTLECIEPGCGYSAPWVVKGPMPPKQDTVVRKARKKK